MAASCPSDQDNWMLAAVGLKYLKEGLEEFADQNLKQQHRDFLNVLPCQTGQCIQCTIDDILPNHSKSSCKDRKKRLLCPAGQCSQMHDLIVSSHRTGEPNWANTDPHQWYSNHISVGTCFINTHGYYLKRSISEIDCAGILSIIINNKFFDQVLGGGGHDDFRKARDARNEILHDANLQILSGKLQHYISLFIKILTCSAIHQTTAVQTAKEKLTLIQNGQYMLSKAEEAQIVKLREKAKAEIEAAASFALTKIDDSRKECIQQVEKKIDTKSEQVVEAIQQTSQQSFQRIHTETKQAVAVIEHTSQIIKTKAEEAVAAVAAVEKRLHLSSLRLDSKTEEAVAAVEQASLRGSQELERRKSKSDGFLSKVWQQRNLKQDLIAYYRREFSTLSISPLFQQNDAPLLQFYRTPSLYQIQEKSSKSEDTSALTCPVHKGQVGKLQTETKSLEDIFFHGKTPNHCIYLTADAGYGKTSFSKKLLIDWCQAQKRDKSDVHLYQGSDVATMKNFDYLFFVPMRKFREVGYLDDMLHRQMVECVHHRYTKTFLQNILENKYCLIILDGLDEWIPSESRFELQVPEWKFRKHCSVLITTRMWKFSTLCPKPKCIHIEMAILKEDDSRWLASRAIAFLNKKNGTNKSSDLFCSQLLEHNLHDIMHVPLLLMQCLCLWYGGRSIGKSHCEIYFNLIELLGMKNEVRLKTVMKESVRSSNIENDLPDWVRENTHCCNQLRYLVALGKLSFFTLFGEDQTSSLVFSESLALMHVTKADLDFGKNIGLLTMETQYGEQSSRLCIISFIHKTYQEILASLYIVSQRPTPYQTYNIINGFCCSVQNVIAMSNVFKFLCRLRIEMFEEIFKRFRHCVEGYKRNMHSFEFDSIFYSYQKMILECIEEAYTSEKRSDRDIQLFDIFVNAEISETDLQILKHIDKTNVLSFYMIDENISSVKLHILNDILQSSVNLKQLVLKSSSLQRNMNNSDIWCCQGLRSLCLDHFEISSLDLSTYIQLECLQLHAIEMLTYIKMPPSVQYLSLQDLICINVLDLSKCQKLRRIHIKLGLLDLDLSACTYLHQLHLEGLKEIKQLDLSHCTQLSNLQMEGLQAIKQLDLSTCTQLQQLQLGDLSEIKQLDLSACTQLQQLHLRSLQAVKQLDLSTCTGLQHLHLEYLRKIKQLNLSACTQLDQLRLDDLLEIKKIDLSACTQLQQLHLRSLQAVKQLDLSACTGLQQLHLECLWEIKQLDMSACTQVQQLHLVELREIKQLDLFSCTRLEHLHLRDLQELKQLDLSKCTHLQRLWLGSLQTINQLDISACAALWQLHLEHLRGIKQLDFSASTQLQQLHLVALGEIKHIDLSDCTHLQQLHLKRLQAVKQLDLSACTELRQLHLEHLSGIKQLDLSACTQLQQMHLVALEEIKQLYLSDCIQLQQLHFRSLQAIKHLDLTACTELRQLHLEYLRKIKQLDLSDWTHIQQLHLESLEAIKQLDLSACTDLRKVHLDNLWEIGKLDLSACTKLQLLHLEHLREIKQLDLSACTDLRQVHLDNLWEIGQLDLSACTRLRLLHLEHLRIIKQLDLSACTTLQQLHMDNLWEIEQLDLSACIQLQQLHLTNFSSISIKNLDLSACTELQQLHLERLKEIKQLDLTACSQLQQLHLMYLREIKQLDLSACTQLQQLYLLCLKEIQQLNLSACTELQQLHLEHLWKIKELDLFPCTRLQQLHLVFLPVIKQLDLSSCAHLQQLYMGYLREMKQLDMSASTQIYQLHIKDIEGIIDLDLATCSQLKQLHLENMPGVKKLDLSSCIHLQKLYLERLHNIEDLNLCSCTELQKACFSELPISNPDMSHCLFLKA